MALRPRWEDDEWRGGCCSADSHCLPGERERERTQEEECETDDEVGRPGPARARCGTTDRTDRGVCVRRRNGRDAAGDARGGHAS
eukprot:7211389-Prymnesium_polylepis.1